MNARSTVSIGILVAACGGGHPAVPDAVLGSPDVLVDSPPILPDAASGPNLACLGAMPRQTAPDPLPLGGKLFAIDHYQVAPLAGASVTLRRRADDQVLASAVTASDGMYAMSVASGGVALDAYFAISAAGFVDARLDPISPISDGDNGLMVVATEAEIARWYVDANLTYAPGSPVVIAAVVDCDRMALGGTTDVVSPTASITYYDDAAQRWDPALAASTNGFALIANPAATTSVTAHRDTTVYPAHAIAAPAATLTVATVQPYQ